RGRALVVFRPFSGDVASRAGQDAFDSRRIANQDDRIARHTGFAPVIELQERGVRWCWSLYPQSCQIGMPRNPVELGYDALRGPREVRRVRHDERGSTEI